MELFVGEQSLFDYLGHSFTKIVNDTSHYEIVGAYLPDFETEDGQCMYNPTVLYLISANGRYYLWAYQTEYDFYGHVDPPPIELKVGMLIEITTGTPEVIATTTEGPEEYYQIHDIPSDILELMGYSEW